MTTLSDRFPKPLPWVVLAALAFSLFLHAKLGMDGSWDTANYHIYLGWAASQFAPYSHGAAAQYHTYLNPLLDLVNYQSFALHPYLGAAIHSAALAAMLGLLFLIATKLLRGTAPLGGHVFPLWATAAGAGGAMTVSLFGSFANEHLTALLLVLAVWKALEWAGQEPASPTPSNAIFWAGAFGGAAAGLKLTAVPLLAGLLLAVALVARLDRKTMLRLLAGTTVGVLATDGLFMALRWLETGNPFFPFANNVFRSPLFASEWMQFHKFEPSAIPYYLSLPFRWLVSGDFSENPVVRDGRLLLGYLGLAMLAVAVPLRKIKLSRAELLLVCVFLFSWLVWMALFRKFRYLVVFELLSGVLFLLGLCKLMPGGVPNLARAKGIAVAALALTTVFLCGVTVYPDWGRRPWSHPFIESDLRQKLAGQGADATVFLADEKLSYLAPELRAAGVRFASLQAQPWFDGNRALSPLDRVPLVPGQRGNTWFLQNTRVPLESAFLELQFGKSGFACVEVKTNVSGNPFLCRFEGAAAQAKWSTIYQHDNPALGYVSGWSHLEKTHRWTEGTKASIVQALPGKVQDCQPKVVLRGNSLGRQPLELAINGQAPLKQDLDGLFEVSAPVGGAEVAEGKPVRLDFALPKAAQPGNGDPRVLALALHSLRFMCE